MWWLKSAPLWFSAPVQSRTLMLTMCSLSFTIWIKTEVAVKLSFIVLLHCRDWRDNARTSSQILHYIGNTIFPFFPFCFSRTSPSCLCVIRSLQSMLARRKGGRTKMLIEQCEACVTLCSACWTCRIFSVTASPEGKSRQCETCCDPCPSVTQCIPGFHLELVHVSWKILVYKTNPCLFSFKKQLIGRLASSRHVDRFMKIKRYWKVDYLCLYVNSKRFVDFDTDTPTSWRVFLIWQTVVKGFFFTRRRILL